MLGQVCTLGRAPRTKETLPDFHEKCRVTRHSRVFRGLTGYQRTPRFWSVTLEIRGNYFLFLLGIKNKDIWIFLKIFEFIKNK